MPKDTKVPTAHNGKRIATTHGFSKQDEERIEKALRDSARVIAPTPIGTARNALASIGKILQNYVFDFNKKNGTGRKPGSRRKGAPGHAGYNGLAFNEANFAVIKELIRRYEQKDPS
ncbi:unnamed protein product [Aureobasidium pullulans]|nr:unnamed protein product [Aureobasidium pullulans]